MNNIFETINLDRIWLYIKRIPIMLRINCYVIMITYHIRELNEH